MSLSGLNDELAQVRTKKKEFLVQIERIVPWNEWIALIKPCYYKGERGNKPYPLELMLRLYLLQNLYNLSYEATVSEAIDSRAFSEFCDVYSSKQVPDGDTLGRFRNILVGSGLQEKLFTQVVSLLQTKELLLKKGTIVDSTIISAPSSTKNRKHQRDPEAYQVKKGNQSTLARTDDFSCSLRFSCAWDLIELSRICEGRRLSLYRIRLSELFLIGVSSRFAAPR